VLIATFFTVHPTQKEIFTMTTSTPSTTYGRDAGTFIDSAAHSAERALHSTQDSAHKALDRLSDQASGLMERGSAAMHQRTEQLRDKARSGRDSTASYIQNEPFKAVLIAASAGIALMLLGNLLSRRSDR